MNAPLQKIEGFLFARVKQELDGIDMNKGAKAMGREFINIIRERTTAGIDINSKQLKPLSKDYVAYKKKVVRGAKKLSVRKGASKKFTYPSKTTIYKAKSTPNHGRLTGNMFYQFQTKDAKGSVIGGKNSLRIKISFKVINNRKVGSNYLIDYYQKEREIFGIATNEQRRKKEIARMLKAFTKATGIKLKTNSKLN